MAKETKNGNGNGFDVFGLAKTWKTMYLEGLETGLRWQETSEQFTKNAVTQGLTVPKQAINIYTEWMDAVAKQVPEAFQAFPAVSFSKPFVQAASGTIEPVVKITEEMTDKCFDRYETAVATPARKQIRQANKQLMDVLIQE